MQETVLHLTMYTISILLACSLCYTLIQLSDQLCPIQPSLQILRYFPVPTMQQILLTIPHLAIELD
jgi:hypothetical protein